MAFWQIEASHRPRLIAVAVPKGSTGRSRSLTCRTRGPPILTSAPATEGSGRSWDAAPTVGEARRGLQGRWLAIRWRLLDDDAAPYGRTVDPPFSIKGRSPPTGGSRVSVSLGGRAVFRRVAASRAGLAPRLQLDRLKAAQALPHLALALNEGEKPRCVRVGFGVVIAEIALVDGGRGLKVPSVSC